MPPGGKGLPSLGPARGANPAPDPGVNGRAEGMALYKRLGRHHEPVSPFCEEYLIDVTATPLTAPDPFNTHLFYGRVLTTIFCMAARPKLSTTRNICAPVARVPDQRLAGHAAPDEPILHEPKHGAGVRVRARNERDTAPLRIRQPPLIYDSVLWSDDPGRTPRAVRRFPGRTPD